jgi:signal transduction histidine kinase/ActR/RegA family two-component response regulator
MLERVLWVIWLMLSAVVAIQLRDVYSSSHWGHAPLLIAAWAVVGASAGLRRVDLRLRGAGLFVGIAVASFSSMLHAGFQTPNQFLGLMMVILLIALAFGRRAAWGALGLSVLGLIAVAVLFVQMTGAGTEPPMVDLRAPQNWLRVILTFVAVTAGTLVCVSYVTSRLESAMLRSEALLDALARESQERLEALEHQRTLFLQLQHAQKLEAIGTLTGGVAHDFNNLLLVIMSHAELIQRRRAHAGGEIDASVKAIEESARRASDLIRQLLAFSRRQIASERRFALDAAVESSLALIRRLLPASIELRFVPASEPITLSGSQLELDQIVMNLCVNARDAMPGGGVIEVATALVTRADGAAEPTTYACLCVRDTGTGMPPEHKDRIFEPFFTTKPPERGTGLGLSVVQGIVSHWEGFIEVESTVGHGTQLRVYLPRAEPDAQLASTEAGPAHSLRGRETVLLVDDEPRVRKVAETILADAGYRVIACADGVEALERFAADPAQIDLVITDTVMPRMGGHELCDAIAVERPELPCLICSGYSPDLVRDGFVGSDHREFLQKPFSADQLLSSARRLLDAAGAIPDATDTRLRYASRGS